MPQEHLGDMSDFVDFNVELRAWSIETCGATAEEDAKAYWCSMPRDVLRPQPVAMHAQAGRPIEGGVERKCFSPGHATGWFALWETSLKSCIVSEVGDSRHKHGFLSVHPGKSGHGLSSALN